MGKSDSDKIKYYEKILKKYKRIADYHTIGQNILEKMPEHLSYEDSVIYKTSALVTAPVLISYVLYILKDGKSRGIQRLYFLSRDGYIMYKIAKVLCNYYHINIECRYVYVSRLALRAPLYLLNKVEALEHFCEPGAKVSVRVVLKRAGINEVAQEEVLKRLHIENIDKPLTDGQLQELKEKLNQDSLFEKQALSYAKERYSTICEYLMQEGFFEEKQYAIVDVGWSGSMQRHIKQILKHAGSNVNMHGYYFAMFENGSKEYGQYHCFYFSKELNSLRRVLFNNNLFECLCSANHGMTIGYDKNEYGLIIPIFKNYELKWNVNLQLDTIERFVNEFVKINAWENIKINQLFKIVKKLLLNFMVFPNLDEASIYGKIPFCDDPTESYMCNLAATLTKEELWRYNIIYKTYKRIYVKREEKKFNESFWINGTIQLSNINNKKLFNLCCIVNEYIHYLRIRKN